MKGILTINSGTYIFRDDHAHGDCIWAWNIHDDYDRAMVHKWNKIPKGAEVHFFDIDNPPPTIPYQPLLD